MIPATVLPLIVAITIAPTVSPIGPEAPPAQALRDDATLNDVTFVDDAFGWAVGNRGAVLHTRDGGRTWQPQPSATDATLEAVHFVDRRIGYAVGGCGRPDGGPGYGVILRTGDGGRSWERLDRAETGWLRAVWADGEARGWVLGDRSPHHPAGLWRFTQAGDRLLPAGERTVPMILAASFQPDGRGIAVGPGGTCVIVRRGQLTPQRRAVSYQGRLRGVALAGDRFACMVGDDATVFTSTDAGRRWVIARMDQPAEIRELLDLTDVALADDRRGWAVGENGRYVLRTVDGGVTWQVRPTGLSAPLRALYAIDTETVVGVGPFGLIARSEDGGLTWSAVRNGDRRAGALVISTGSAAWVWPVMAHLVGHYRCRVAYLRVVDDGTPDEAIRWAGNACGVSAVRTLVDFRAPSADGVGTTTLPADRRAESPGATPDPFAYWSRQLDRDAATAMRRQLVAAIRDVQPAVVVTDEGGRNGRGDHNGRGDRSGRGDPVASAVAGLVWEAVDLAAQDQAMAEQRRLGLAPWLTPRVVALAGDGAPPDRRGGSEAKGKIRVDFNDGVHSLLGSDSRLAGLRALGCLGLSSAGLRESIGLRPVRGTEPDRRTMRLLSGVRLPAQARLTWLEPDEDPRLAALEEAAAALAAAADLVERGGNPAELVEMAMRAARQFPDAIAPADALYRAALQYEQRGQHQSASEVWRVFSRIGRSHPAWTRTAVRQALVQASAERYMSLPVRPKDALSGARFAAAALDRLCDARPYLLQQADVLFARAHCRRVLGQFGPARRLYRECVSTRAPGFATAAAGELWLLDPPTARRGICPRRMIEARRSTRPVQVDGILDDPVWQGSSAPALTDTNGQPVPASLATHVRAAWDSTYLYLAATVRTKHGRTGPPAGHAPVRDRLDDDWPAIEWLIDVDRDAATYYRLAVDEVGNVLDAHDADRSWTLPIQSTPAVGAWQYIVRHEADGWQVEMAVPMVSMSPRPLAKEQVWAIQAVRRPGACERGAPVQWLSAPSGRPTVGGERFALLTFAGAR